MPSVHVGARCTHGMMYPCAKCTCGCQVYTCYDVPMCQVDTWVPGLHMVWHTHVPGVHVGARCTHIMTYPCVRCAHGITPMCRVYMWVPGVHVVWCTHVPGVHMGAKCTHGMTYPCVGCTCGCQVYTWYDIPMCRVYSYSSRLVYISPDNDLPHESIKVRHFNPWRSRVRPEQFVMDPVHCYATYNNTTLTLCPTLTAVWPVARKQSMWSEHILKQKCQTVKHQLTKHSSSELAKSDL